MTEAIRVNFSKPIPLFPLPDTVLLPHAVLPLHVFEPRYRQMVDDCLDGIGQIAMATFAGKPAQWKEEYHAQPELRPAVCVGQIIQHEAMPDGRHNILLHGVCRAKIVEIDEPTEERTYRCAELTPLEIYDEQTADMPDVRKKLRTLLDRPRLKKMRSVGTVAEWFDRTDIPTHALLELIGFTLVKNNDVKYNLLAESDPLRRAAVIQRELMGIDHLVSRAEAQGYESWPKGMSWN